MSKPYDYKFRIGGNRFGLFIFGWDNFWFRVFGKGVSVQPLKEDLHHHLFSTRHAKIQPLHLFKHCWRILLK